MLSDPRGFGSHWSETIFWSHFFSFLSVTTTLMSTKLGLQDPYITLNNLCVFIHMQCSSVSNNVCASHIFVWIRCGSCVRTCLLYMACYGVLYDLVWKLWENMSAVHDLLWCFVWIWCGSCERTCLLYMACYCGHALDLGLSVISWW
jgi:hypothetical protein